MRRVSFAYSPKLEGHSLRCLQALEPNSLADSWHQVIHPTSCQGVSTILRPHFHPSTVSQRLISNSLENDLLPGWGSGRRQVDPVAELLQTAYSSALDCLTVAFVEVVAAQVLVGRLPSDQVVAGDQ